MATKQSTKQTGGTQNTATDKTAVKQPGNTKGEVPVLMVKTKRGIASFRRAGFRFTREPIGIELAALEEDQVKALKDEPNLVVEEGSIDASEVAG